MQCSGTRAGWFDACRNLQASASATQVQLVWHLCTTRTAVPWITCMQVFGGFHVQASPRNMQQDGRVRGVSEHDGAAVLSVHAMEGEEVRIVIHADGVLSHPLNVWPHDKN